MQKATWSGIRLQISAPLLPEIKERDRVRPERGITHWDDQPAKHLNRISKRVHAGKRATPPRDWVKVNSPGRSQQGSGRAEPANQFHDHEPVHRFGGESYGQLQLETLEWRIWWNYWEGEWKFWNAVVWADRWRTIWGMILLKFV